MKDLRSARPVPAGTELCAAIDRGLLEVCLQPVMSLTSARPAGLAAALRLPAGELGEVSVEEVFSAAERSGFAPALGAVLLGRCCRLIGDWRAAGMQLPRIVATVSAQELDRPDFADDVLGLLHDACVSTSELSLAISGSSLLGRWRTGEDVVDELQWAGVEVGVRVDRALATGVPHQPHAVALTEQVIERASGWSTFVLAEGISTREQAEALRRAGCTLGLGV